MKMRLFHPGPLHYIASVQHWIVIIRIFRSQWYVCGCLTSHVGYLIYHFRVGKRRATHISIAPKEGRFIRAFDEHVTRFRFRLLVATVFCVWQNAKTLFPSSVAHSAFTFIVDSRYVRREYPKNILYAKNNNNQPPSCLVRDLDNSKTHYKLSIFDKVLCARTHSDAHAFWHIFLLMAVVFVVVVARHFGEALLDDAYAGVFVCGGGGGGEKNVMK